jgi:hypothetical protein
MAALPSPSAVPLNCHAELQPALNCAFWDLRSFVKIALHLRVFGREPARAAVVDPCVPSTG